MKIVVSNTYQKWAKANFGNAETAIEKFLLRVFNSDNIANVTPTPKSVGNNLRKVPGVVDEFTLNRKYRLYSKCLEFKPGTVAFYLATVGSKGVTNQNDDILKALSLFDDVNATEWENWEPSPKQIQVPDVQESQPVENAPQASSAVAASEQKSASKKKGKPVDENGLTVAERKALQKKERQEAAKKREEDKKRQKELERAEKERIAKEEKQVEQERIAATTTKKTANAASDTPAKETPDNIVPVIIGKHYGATPAETETPDNDTHVVTETTESNPEVSLNGAPMDTPRQPTGDVTFQDVAHTQYELEVIEHQINIEKLNIEIIQQNIAMAQHKIKLEQLMLERLKLLQTQKTQQK